MRVGRLNCVAQRVVEHFEFALKGQGLKPIGYQKIQVWEAKVHKHGDAVKDVADLEEILKRTIVLEDISGGNICDSGKYGRGGHWPIELIYHNGHAWSKDLTFHRATFCMWMAIWR